jgi:DNA-binding beta-propeller fold protein YncE
VSTASYSQQKSVSAQGLEPRGLYFKSDGLRVFTADAATNSVFSYTLSTAWDISTASYDSKSLVTTSDGEDNPQGIVFNQDGTFLYVVGDGARAILQYQLTTAYDLSTATITSSSYAFNQNIGGIHIKPDNTKVYLVDYSQDVVTQITSTLKTEELDLSTGNYFNHTLTENTKFPLSNAGDVQAFQLEVTGGAIKYAISSAVQDTTFNVAAQGLNPTGIAFKPDGTKMYVCNYGDDEIQEWNLSTAWDLSTATYDSRLLITTNASNPRGLFISPDGINVYVGDAQTLALVQYTLSTAWDISTGSYTRNKAVSSLGSSVAPENVFFKPDGTKLYLVTAGDAWQSTLSTAWDISTATYDSIVATDPRIAIFIPSDGLNLFSWTNDIIHRYPLSTAWDLSTIGSSAESFDLELTNTSCKGIAFKPDGTKMYFVHSGTDLAYQYSTVTDTTLTWPSSIEWAAGTAPAAPANGETDVFTFTTDDGGTTYTGIQSIDNAS